jgi:hypothetical protein
MRSPPKVEYMREGYTADDAWMMVEDEFVDTARMFTAPIHRSEYERLKRLSKSRGAETLEAIARSTDGRTAQSVSTKLKREAEGHRTKFHDGMKNILRDESEGEDDEYMQDPQLAGLMTGSQPITQELTGTAKVRSNTRAAAGFSKSPRKDRWKDKLPVRSTPKTKPAPAAHSGEDTETEDSDDLDAPPRRTKAATPKPEGSSSTRGDGNPAKSNGTSGIFKQFAKPTDQSEIKPRDNVQERSMPRNSAERTNHSLATQSSRSSSIKTSGFISLRKDYEPGIFGFLPRRKAREKQEQEEKIKKGNAAIDVPTFII